MKKEDRRKRPHKEKCFLLVKPTQEILFLFISNVRYWVGFKDCRWEKRTSVGFPVLEVFYLPSFLTFSSTQMIQHIFQNSIWRKTWPKIGRNSAIWPRTPWRNYLFELRFFWKQTLSQCRLGSSEPKLCLHWRLSFKSSECRSMVPGPNSCI